MPEYARPAAWPDVPLVDTDVHITPRSIAALCPYLPARWRDYIRESGVRSLESDLYPPRSPLSAIPGARPADGPPASDPGLLRAQLLDPWRVQIAITHCIYGIDGIHNPDWAVAMAAAVNDWQLAEWLAGDPRLRGSVVVAAQDPAGAAAEIDRVGDRPEFVQVLMPVRMRAPLGTRAFWPIYEAAERHGLALAVYAGGAGGEPDHAGRVAELLPRGVRRPGPSVPGPGGQPGLRGRAGAVPAAADRAGRVGVHVAAAADVAAGQELEGPAPRGALGGPAPVGDDPGVGAAHRPAARRARRRARPAARSPRPPRQRPHAHVRHRLPAPPVRRPGARRARGPVRGGHGPLPRRQRVRHLSAWSDVPMLVDCDIHNELVPGALRPYLSQRWRDHDETYGDRGDGGSSYPKGAPRAARADAWPPSGLPPGADLEFLRAQHLDAYDVRYGVLNCLTAASRQQNPGYAAALCRAVNEWQVAEWLEKEPRLRAGIVVPYEDAASAAAEIDRAAAHPGFVQVLLLVRTDEPLGRRRYRPIFEAAVRNGLPVGIHFGGGRGRNPLTASGWPSFYIEDHTAMAQAFQTQVVSMVVEGLFEELPTLRVVLIEGGFGWLPSLMWRMDKHWARLADEVPHLTRAAVGVRPGAHLGHHPADRGAARPAAPARRVRQHGRHRPDHVLDRLPALGLRRPAPGAARQAAARSASADLRRQRHGALRPGREHGRARRGHDRRDPAGPAQDRRDRRAVDRGVQRRRALLRAAQHLPARGRPGSARARCPGWSRRARRGSTATSGRARSCGARGTAGSST